MMSANPEEAVNGDFFSLKDLDLNQPRSAGCDHQVLQVLDRRLRHRRLPHGHDRQHRAPRRGRSSATRFANTRSSIGKDNFFLFAEIVGDDEKLADTSARTRRSRIQGASSRLRRRARFPALFRARRGDQRIQESRRAARPVDGPFAETREVLGGFYVIDVPDLDVALDWAARVPGVAGRRLGRRAAGRGVPGGMSDGSRSRRSSGRSAAGCWPRWPGGSATSTWPRRSRPRRSRRRSSAGRWTAYRRIRAAG